MLDTPTPLINDAWKAVVEAYASYEALRLAVSGGPDSLAMLAGFAQLRDAGLLRASFDVVTVDHGLRAESAHEVQMVAGVCNDLGVACHTVRLSPSPDMGNKQAWARSERYRAFAKLDGAFGRPVLTAHTADDQAETLLMRAARGAGSEGLAAIRSSVRVAGVLVHRPFLSWRRDELHAVLNGSPWQAVQDPSNDDPLYTRVRYRRWLADAPVPDSARQVVHGLAETARIVSLESTALDHYADQLVSEVGGVSRGFVDGHLKFASQPRAVQARFLRLVLAAVARVDGPGPDVRNSSFDLGRMMKLAESVEAESTGRWVGGGAVLDWRPAAVDSAAHVHLVAFAEGGRMGFPQIEVEAGASSIWDHRFEIKNRSSKPVLVRAWKPADPLPDAGGAMPPKVVLTSLPVALQGDEVVEWADGLSNDTQVVDGPFTIAFLRRS